MSMAYIAQPEQQQKLEWLAGGTLAMLLDGKATDGQLMIGRFDVSEGEVFLLIKGTALVWCDDQEYELAEGGIVYLPKKIPHGYRITSKKADLLMINTPAGIEGMFRETGRDKSTPRPADFQITPDSAISEQYGNIIIGPPRRPARFPLPRLSATPRRKGSSHDGATTPGPQRALARRPARHRRREPVRHDDDGCRGTAAVRVVAQRVLKSWLVPGVFLQGHWSSCWPVLLPLP